MGPWDLFRSFKICSDAKESGVRKPTGSLPHLYVPSKTATLIPEFAVKDLPLGRTSNLVPGYAVKTCPWAEQSDGDEYDDDYNTIFFLVFPTFKINGS